MCDIRAPLQHFLHPAIHKASERVAPVLRQGDRATIGVVVVVVVVLSLFPFLVPIPPLAARMAFVVVSFCFCRFSQLCQRQ